MPTLESLHKNVLLNQIRVKTSQAGGSGTIIYSKSFPEGYHNYAITCHHVISNAISVKQEWDSTVGRERKKEYRQVVTVEFFDWTAVPHGHRPLTSSIDAEIVAYDTMHDMAILRLRTISAVPAIATLLTPGREKEILVGTECVAVGCALLHDPIVTHGHITHMGTEIDYKDYWMSSAQIIFGNSGGAVFIPEGDSYYFIGIPSRIDIQGWGNPITHLGYFSPIERVYKFFDEQAYHFLIPGHPHTEKECEEEREKRKQLEERRLRLDAPEADTLTGE